MPLFKPKSSSSRSSSSPEKMNNGAQDGEGHDTVSNSSSQMNTTNGNGKRDRNSPQNRFPEAQTDESKTQLVFRCQLAHGSPTGFISGFSNVRELYQRIADCHDLPASEVSFYLFSFLFHLFYYPSFFIPFFLIHPSPDAGSIGHGA
uniref:Gipc1 protein n=1 Tax=Fopius arisanus TaxID=64838 RepID=A0A0C9QW17_9HYME